MSESKQNSVKKSEENKETNKNRLKFIIKKSSSYKSLCGLLSGVCLTSFIFLVTLPNPEILNETFYQWALGCFVISFLMFFVSLIVFNWIESICYIEKYIDTNLIKDRLLNRTAIMDLFANFILFGGAILIAGIAIVFIHFSPTGFQNSLIFLSVLLPVLCCLYINSRQKKKVDNSHSKE